MYKCSGVYFGVDQDLGRRPDDEKNESIGKGKAISEIRKDGAEFKLSKECIKTLGFIFTTISLNQNSGSLLIRKKSLVKFRDQKGIYIRRDGWFMLVKVIILSEKDSKYLVKPKGRLENDELVENNIGLMRVTHLHAMGALGDVDMD
jgi:hypothetical protein